MSNESTLHNSYKCYDSIPTPSPTALDDSKRTSGSSNANFMHQSFASNANNNSSVANLLRTASLDSLINSSEQDSGSNHSEDDDDEISDSDSLTELANICDNNSKNSLKDSIETSVDYEPRKSDIEELEDGIEPPKEPVIQAYLEKCHKKCEYKNCCFKKSSTESDIKKSSNQSQNQVKSNLSSRRNSIASAVSVSRMETILEEPTEPKISVKEILARFETLREAAEVMKEIDLVRWQNYS